MDDTPLHRTPEVAAHLNISGSQVYELMSSGALPSVHIDRTRLVHGVDLRAYVDALTVAV